LEQRGEEKKKKQVQSLDKGRLNREGGGETWSIFRGPVVKAQGPYVRKKVTRKIFHHGREKRERDCRPTA